MDLGKTKKEVIKIGTKLKRRRKTRKEKIEESKGKTPKRLVKELNEMGQKRR